MGRGESAQSDQEDNITLAVAGGVDGKSRSPRRQTIWTRSSTRLWVTLIQTPPLPWRLRGESPPLKPQQPLVKMSIWSNPFTPLAFLYFAYGLKSVEETALGPIIEFDSILGSAFAL